MTRTSNGIPNSCSMSKAGCISGSSDLLPITTATKGMAFLDVVILYLT